MKTVAMTKEGDFAISVATEAGRRIARDFKPQIRTQMKRDGTPVTDTDKEVNAFVIREISKSFPEHDILAEEGSKITKHNAYRWVCDPIDGTVSFSHSCPTFAFSLALLKEGMPVVGVAYDPMQDRLFFAEKGNGATLNGARIQVSEENKIRGAVVGISAWNGAQFSLEPLSQRLMDRGAAVLRLGSIVYMGALVSCGEFAASVHPARMSYDSAALKLIVEEANGKVTDIFGKDQRYGGRIRGCIMSNRALHNTIEKLFRQ